MFLTCIYVLAFFFVSHSILGLEPGSGPQGPRRIHTMTTIPFGHVDEQDVDMAMEESYDKPLRTFLFDKDYKDVTPTTEQLLVPAIHWLQRRNELGDIDSIDPTCKESFVKIHEQFAKHVEAVAKVAEQERMNLEQTTKWEVAADTMLARQKNLLVCDGHNHEESPLYRTHKANIEQWFKNKVDLQNRSFSILLNRRDQLQEGINELVYKLIEESYMLYLKDVLPHNSNQAPDCDLMRELEKVIDTQAPQFVIAIMHVYRVRYKQVFLTCFWQAFAAADAGPELQDLAKSADALMQEHREVTEFKGIEKAGQLADTTVKTSNQIHENQCTCLLGSICSLLLWTGWWIKACWSTPTPTSTQDHDWEKGHHPVGVSSGITCAGTQCGCALAELYVQNNFDIDIVFNNVLYNRHHLPAGLLMWRLRVHLSLTRMRGFPQAPMDDWKPELKRNIG